jgi:hypothetical protein
MLGLPATLRNGSAGVNTGPDARRAASREATRIPQPHPRLDAGRCANNGPRGSADLAFALLMARADRRDRPRDPNDEGAGGLMEERMTYAQKARARDAALRAKRLYPGVVGEVLARALYDWADFGFRFGPCRTMDLMQELERHTPPRMDPGEREAG